MSNTADLRFVVRHAKAGRRSEWVGDDRVRPLSKTGWKQARAVADRLADQPVTSLVASPYLRCVQTLEPLADRIGTKVVTDERLAEGAAFETSLELLLESGPGVVLSSHGDVIPDLIGAVVRRGADLRTKPDWRKAVIWTLTVEGARVVRVKAQSPPKI
ncbi:MAG: SixA phosphatase family protein [Desertimonas sp.]